MPDRRTLLERLHHPVPASASELAQLRASILHNLSVVICAHPGSMKAELPTDRVRVGMPSLGLTLHAGHTGRGAEEDADGGLGLRDDLPTRLRALIRAHEPRLLAETVQVEVHPHPTRPGALRVAVSGAMRGPSVEGAELHLDATLNAEGRLLLEHG